MLDNFRALFVAVSVCTFYDSHEKREQSLETRPVYMEIWNLPNDPKHWRSILRNMASAERDRSLARAFHAIMDKLEADILWLAKKWNWKLIFINQGCIFRKITAINARFVPKYVHLQGWSRKFGAKYKDAPTKILKHHARANSS